MTTENERELAQVERTDATEDAREFALVIVEVAGRDHLGRICQFRGMREATPEEVVQHWRRQGGGTL